MLSYNKYLYSVKVRRSVITSGFIRADGSIRPSDLLCNHISSNFPNSEFMARHDGTSDNANESHASIYTSDPYVVLYCLENPNFGKECGKVVAISAPATDSAAEFLIGSTPEVRCVLHKDLFSGPGVDKYCYKTHLVEVNEGELNGFIYDQRFGNPQRCCVYCNDEDTLLELKLKCGDKILYTEHRKILHDETNYSHA